MSKEKTFLTMLILDVMQNGMSLTQCKKVLVYSHHTILNIHHVLKFSSSVDLRQILIYLFNKKIYKQFEIV